MQKNLNLTNIDKICNKNLTKSICKTILSVYNLLPMITNSLDKLIMKKAENSMSLIMGDTVENCSREIIELTEQKISLINLKVLLDNSLGELSENNARLIMMRFVDGINCEDCIKILKIDKRTFFRRLAVALDNFCKVFNFKLLQKRIRQGILGQELMEDVFSKLDNFVAKGGSIEKNRDSICGLILNRLRRVCK